MHFVSTDDERLHTMAAMISPRAPRDGDRSRKTPPPSCCRAIGAQLAATRDTRQISVEAVASKLLLSKGQILQNVWRYDFNGNANVVETYVSYLRRKLDTVGPPLIKTVRQAGYMLEA